jgi:signal transduction histidine kinase
LLAGAVTATVLFSPQEFNISSLWAIALLIGVPLLPGAAAVAVLRHRLLDLDVVINRTIVYGLLSGVLVLAYLAVVEVARALVGSDAGLGASLPAAAIVAVLFAPARQFLQKRVDTALYGSRGDPARTLSTVTTMLEGFPGDELVAALESLAESMRLPGVAIAVEGRRIGGCPEGDGRPEAIPLKFRSEAAGELLVWPRRGQARLGTDDLATLHLVAAPLAATVHALRVNDQLQQSRRQLITAREEEQRRLHHDLHDGLGPTLTAIALKADAARRDPKGSQALLSQISSEAREAIGEVRRIAHDLRSPRLESLGLLGALQYQAAQLSSGSDRCSVTVEMARGEGVPPIATDIEQAAYQVASEAITNAVRHAGATRITVRLTACENLTLEIADDGPATTGQWQEGFGLSGMRQRAARHGGDLQAGPTPEGGLVTLTLPLGDRTGVAT